MITDFFGDVPIRYQCPNNGPTNPTSVRALVKQLLATTTTTSSTGTNTATSTKLIWLFTCHLYTLNRNTINRMILTIHDNQSLKIWTVEFENDLKISIKSITILFHLSKYITHQA